jgi:hypothetical protein
MENSHALSAEVDQTRRGFLGTIAALSAATGAVAASGLAGCAAATTKAAAERTQTEGATADIAQGAITVASIAEAEKLAGIAFTESERAQMLRTISTQVAGFRARAAFGAIDNSLAPAQVFRVLPRAAKRKSPV